MPFALASDCFGRIFEGQRGLGWPLRTAFGPRLVGIRFREGPVELVRNGVKVRRHRGCVDVDSHGCGHVLERLLHHFDVGGGYGKAGRGVPQLVRRQPMQPGLLRYRVEEPRPEVRIA